MLLWRNGPVETKPDHRHVTGGGSCTDGPRAIKIKLDHQMQGDPGMSSNRKLAIAAAGVAITVMAAQAARAADVARIAIGVGYYDIFEQLEDEAAEFRLEYRPSHQVWLYEPYVSVKGFVGLAATTSGSVFVGLGPMLEVVIAEKFVLSASVGPFGYVQGGADADLGYPLEFRSQAEVAYQFDNLSRLGVAISHYSNAGLGDENPGVETVSLYYSFPF